MLFAWLRDGRLTMMDARQVIQTHARRTPSKPHPLSVSYPVILRISQAASAVV
jgi:hypothetical protein